MASRREERQSARSGLGSEGERLGEESALAGADPPPCPQVHPALCAWPWPPLGARDGRARPAAPCLLSSERLVSCFCRFVFGLACLLLKGKNTFVTISSKTPVLCLNNKEEIL